MSTVVRQTPQFQPAQAWLIHDGASLHLQHGPIDLIITATGSAQAVQKAYQQANFAFQQVLTTLVAELEQLRLPVSELAGKRQTFKGPVAQRMAKASLPHRSEFVTPMAAVAGAVADHVLCAALERNPLSKLLVNNGGDIALYLGSEQSCTLGICNNLQSTSHSDTITLMHTDGIGGVATSGWQGRSHSLGIADAVTVLARDAAMADVAATLIANAVDVPDSEKIQRQAADSIQPDSDLGNRLVTVGVAQLSASEIDTALARGLNCAKQLEQHGLIHSAYIYLQGASHVLSGRPGHNTAVDELLLGEG